jgi:hypothetical protein
MTAEGRSMIQHSSQCSRVLYTQPSSQAQLEAGKGG